MSLPGGEQNARARLRRPLLELVVPGLRDPENAVVLELPDVGDLSLGEAALAYARCGWFVLPTRPGDIKNPGSVVGGAWHERSSRDPARIKRWWTENPNYGVALHVGRSGASVFDLDIDDLALLPPDLAKALRSATAIQGTRSEGDRGHYIFALEDGDDFGNAAGGFARYGEHRGRNGVIIASPTPHPDADSKAGAYVQRKTGFVGGLPLVLRECLSVGSEDADPKTPAELDAFLAAHTEEDRPGALHGPLTDFAAKTGDGASRHATMCEALCWAFREAVAGCYPAQRAYGELSAAFAAAKPDRAPGEFERMAQWAAAQAELADPVETLRRMDRNLWPAPMSPLPVAQAIAHRARAEHRPLARWRGTWLRWGGVCWVTVSDESMRNLLYRTLQNAVYEGKDGTRPRWNPDKGKIDKVLDALKSVTLLSNTVTKPSWLTASQTHVIACANGLLRVEDGTLLEHTPDYFNTFALPFAYDPQAAAPERWMQFVAEVFPDDAESHTALQEWFGYVLSGRTDMQKMAMFVGRPRSGKGTIDKVLQALVGAENHVGLAGADLRNDFGLQVMLDKTVAVFSDDRVSVESRRFVEALLRITGEDTVTVHRKYRDPWVGRLPARLMFMSNEPPSLPDSSGAIVSRILPFVMPVSFDGKEDLALATTLMGELPGILNWSLEGLTRLYDRGRFQIPETGAALTGLLQEGASPVTQFVEAECDIGTGLWVSKDDLFAKWKNWCLENGHTPGSKALLGKKLFAAYSTRIRESRRGAKGEQYRGYEGIGVHTYRATRLTVDRDEQQSGGDDG